MIYFKVEEHKQTGTTTVYYAVASLELAWAVVRLYEADDEVVCTSNIKETDVVKFIDRNGESQFFAKEDFLSGFSAVSANVYAEMTDDNWDNIEFDGKKTFCKLVRNDSDLLY